MTSADCIRFDLADEDLQFRVESFLRSRHFPAFEQIEVDVHNGSVTLSGILRSYYEKQVAISSCQRVAGVIDLIDNLDVEIRSVRNLAAFRTISQPDIPADLSAQQAAINR